MEAESAVAAESTDVPVAAEVSASTSQQPLQEVENGIAPASPTPSLTLKRSADSMLELDERGDSKRKKRSESASPPSPKDNPEKLLEDMGLELSCGCCTALCYNPVLVLPCQHYYCGSCYTLWTRNGGVNCPSCRSPVSSIIPSRAIQSLIEVYLRSAPSRNRVATEKEQADEIYQAGNVIGVPTPRPKSPDIPAPSEIDSDAYYRPCPHCPSPNDFNWSCPNPISLPSTSNPSARSYLISDGIPPEHAVCGSCDHLHNPSAPASSRCDFCSKTFCGLVVPSRCHAKRVREQRPTSGSGGGDGDSMGDMLANASERVYESLSVNTVEFDFLFDHLRERNIGVRAIYSEIIEHILASPEGWKPLVEFGVFSGLTLADLPPIPQPVPAEAVSPPIVENTTTTETPLSPVPITEESSNSIVTSVDVTLPSDAGLPVVDIGSPTASNDIITAATIAAVEPIVSDPVNTEPPSQPLLENRETVTAMETDVDIRRDEDTVMDIADVSPVNNVVNDAPITTDTESNAPAAILSRPVTPIVVPEPLPPPPNQAQDSIVIMASPASSASGSTSGSEDHSSPSSPEEPPADPVSNPDNSNNHNSSEQRPRRLSKICRNCAADVFFWGLRTWWIRERARAAENGELSEDIKKRKDCESLESGTPCDKEGDNSHAREFNHIPKPPVVPGTASKESTAVSSSTETPDSSDNSEVPEGTREADPPVDRMEVDVSIPAPEEEASTRRALEALAVESPETALPRPLEDTVEPVQISSPNNAANGETSSGVITELMDGLETEKSDPPTSPRPDGEDVAMNVREGSAPVPATSLEPMIA